MSRIPKSTRKTIRVKRTHRVTPAFRRVERSNPVVVVRRISARQIPRPQVRRTYTRTPRPVLKRDIRFEKIVLPEPTGPDAYVDYARVLTPEGGILITYKDVDLRLRHTVWRIFAWSASTGFAAWLLFVHRPMPNRWIGAGLLLAMAFINWLIVRKPVEVYRTVEIRPDCMIIEGADLFWRRMMECGWPAFQPDKERNLLLSGIYGTRFVEYLTVRRFDQLDRMPEVMAAHLQDAMDQLWNEDKALRNRF